MFRLIFALAFGAAWAVAARAGDSIKVGEYASLTGKEATYGQASHQGTLLAIEQVNARGGVLGRPVELLTEDNQSRQGESATAVKKLISRDHVVAMLGEVASIRSLEAAPILQAAHIPMVSPSSVNAKVTQAGNYIFRVCFIDAFEGPLLARFAAGTLHARRVAILTSVSNAYSIGMTKYFKERFVADGGTVAVESRYNEGDKDFRAQLTSIRAAQVDAIFASGYYTEAALICVQARALGLTLPIFGGDGWDSPALLEIGGRAMEGTYFATHFAPDNPSPEVQNFNRDYQARWGAPPDAMAALGYDSAVVLCDAIRRAGSDAPDRIRDALATTRDVPGVTGRITIDADRNARKPAVILTVKDGKYRYVSAAGP
jgi:branched-chain amino acid transport system substrate-binding protein